MYSPPRAKTLKLKRFGEGQIQFGKELSTKNIALNFSGDGRNWRFAFIFFLHEVMFSYFWREIFKGSHFEFFAKKVARGNAVQIFSNFPAKSLSIYRKNFSRHLFN